MCEEMTNQFNPDTYCGIYCGACSIAMLGKTGRADGFADCLGTVPKEDLACGGCKSDRVYAGCSTEEALVVPRLRLGFFVVCAGVLSVWPQSRARNAQIIRLEETPVPFRAPGSVPEGKTKRRLTNRICVLYAEPAAPPNAAPPIRVELGFAA